MISRPIGKILFDYAQWVEDGDPIKKEIIGKAIELGCDEKAINNNHRIAIAYLRGYQKGKQ